MKYSTELGRRIAECILEDKRVDVIVAPAKGRPGGKWEFRCAPRDFAAIVLAKLWRLTKEFNPDTLVIDVTHGINYMPTEVVYAARWLLSLYLLKKIFSEENGNLKGLELVIVNSDPYPLSTEGRPSLSLNLVYREKVRTITKLSAIPRQLVKPLRKLEPDLERKLNELNHLYRLSAAYPYAFMITPMPLALYRACSEQRRVADRDLVKEAISLWITMTEVKNVDVDHLLRLSPEAVYVHDASREVCNRVGGRHGEEEGVDIGYLLSSIARIYSVVDEVYEVLVNTELGKLKKDIENRGGGWLRLCELYGECKKREQMDKRTAFAHAGLQSEFVEINPVNNKIRYVKSVTIEKLMTWLGISLEEPL